MIRADRVTLFPVLMFSLLGFAAVQKAQAGAAPLPAEIAAAKRIFIANGGEDTRLNDFSGGSIRCYSQFYTAMKTWGKYELVASPSDADLIAEIEFRNPPDAAGLHREGIATYYYDPQFKLSLIDPKTHTTEWVFLEHADGAVLQRNRDKNFDSALARIVMDFKTLVDPNLSGGQP